VKDNYCLRCKHWINLRYLKKDTGLCKRMPPTPIIDGDEITKAWPITDNFDECGAFEELGV